MNYLEQGYINLTDVAKLVADWFPALGGRSFPAMGDDITKDNIPTMPFAALIPMAINVEDYPVRGNGRTSLLEDFQIEFWLNPQQIKRSDKSETPFWAYYDYQGYIVRPLIGNMQKLVSESGVLFEFLGAQVASTDAAIIIALRFRQHYTLCADEPPEPRDAGYRIITNICPA